MNYTIATMQEIASHDTINLVADGNKFYIEYVSEGKRTVRKHFDSITEASTVFQRFAAAFVNGDYSYNDRKSWLE